MGLVRVGRMLMGSLGPFVTAVGGTTGIEPETAISFSGGGFSNYFSQPPYQAKDVTAYIENLGGTYDGLYKCGLRSAPEQSG